ncbi:MAG: hypothetical protein IKJ82_03730 [Oscillospiraceae bacterium]|nr:hypothetical protein [Oscillospiraceae bacterium]
MKKLVLMIAALAMLFAGCAGNDPKIDPDLIKFDITYSDSEIITFDVINNSANEIAVGYDFSLEYQDGNEWFPVEIKEEVYVYPMADCLLPGEKRNYSFGFTRIYGELSDGNYRIYQDIELYNEDGEQCGTQRVYAEFKVSVKER